MDKPVTPNVAVDSGTLAKGSQQLADAPHPHSLRPFDEQVGILLAPYESLLAMLGWLRECLAESHTPCAKVLHLRPPPAIHHHQREKLLSALLLFGKFDGLPGLLLLDAYLKLHGYQQSRREIFGDFVEFRDEDHSPFAHCLEEGWSTGIWHPAVDLDTDAGDRLTPAITRALKRAGFAITNDEAPPHDVRFGTLSRGAIRHKFREQATLYPSKLVVDFSLIGQCVTSTLAMLDRSITSGLPVLSDEAAGPAWATDHISERIRILRVVWGEAKWLPHPKTFREALAMSEDDRMRSLRDDIDLWHHKLSVGDIGGIGEIKDHVRRDVERFHGKPWSTRVCRLADQPNVSPVLATARHFGPPPTECKPRLLRGLSPRPTS